MWRKARSVGVAVGLVLATVLFSLGFAAETFASSAPAWQEAVYAVLGGALAYGALAHALSHLGYVLRLCDEQDAPCRTGADAAKARFGALIPAYREKPEFVFRAMLSVALQRHDKKWLRLLVDDPPAPRTAEDGRTLVAARALPGRVRAVLAPMEAIAAEALAAADADAGKAPLLLAELHRRLSVHLAALARDWPEATADDRFFRDRVLARLAWDHADDACRAADRPDEALAELARLRDRFRCDVEVHRLVGGMAQIRKPSLPRFGRDRRGRSGPRREPAG